jgi:hypothetical protein
MSKDITQNALSDREALLPEADHVFTELTGLKMLFSPLHHRVATSPSLNRRNHIVIYNKYSQPLEGWKISRKSIIYIHGSSSQDFTCQEWKKR